MVRYELQFPVIFQDRFSQFPCYLQTPNPGSRGTLPLARSSMCLMASAQASSKEAALSPPWETRMPTHELSNSIEFPLRECLSSQDSGDISSLPVVHFLIPRTPIFPAVFIFLLFYRSFEVVEPFIVLASRSRMPIALQQLFGFHMDHPLSLRPSLSRERHPIDPSPSVVPSKRRLYR